MCEMNMQATALANDILETLFILGFPQMDCA
jgi:hypothetical protein